MHVGLGGFQPKYCDTKILMGKQVRNSAETDNRRTQVEQRSEKYILVQTERGGDRERETDKQRNRDERDRETVRQRERETHTTLL